MTKWDYCCILRDRNWKERPKDKGWHESNAWITHYYTSVEDVKIWKENITALLNKLGDEGWELVSVSNRSSVLGGTTTTSEMADGIFRNKLGSAADYAGFTSEELWVLKRPRPE